MVLAIGRHVGRCLWELRMPPLPIQAEGFTKGVTTPPIALCSCLTMRLPWGAKKASSRPVCTSIPLGEGVPTSIAYAL